MAIISIIIYDYCCCYCNYYYLFMFYSKGNKRTRDIWWQGIPPSIRGKVWILAIGNELNITHGKTLLLAYIIAPYMTGTVQ